MTGKANPLNFMYDAPPGLEQGWYNDLSRLPIKVIHYIYVPQRKTKMKQSRVSLNYNYDRTG